MEKYEQINAENCYICNEFMGAFKSDLTIVTSFSEKPLFELIGKIFLKFHDFWNFNLFFSSPETFTNAVLADEIINESGVCQNCLIKLNEYDEHQTLANQIQEDIVGLIENKAIISEDDHKIKEEHDDSADAIEYEPFEGDEIYVAEGAESETFEEALEEDYHFEVVVDDTKENLKKQVRQIKSEENDYIVIELENNQRLYQCDICNKTCKDKSKLRTHREIHTEERNVICPVSNFEESL